MNLQEYKEEIEWLKAELQRVLADNTRLYDEYDFQLIRKRLDELKEQNKIMREALEYYAGNFNGRDGTAK